MLDRDRARMHRATTRADGPVETAFCPGVEIRQPVERFRPSRRSEIRDRRAAADAGQLRERGDGAIEAARLQMLMRLAARDELSQRHSSTPQRSPAQTGEVMGARIRLWVSGSDWRLMAAGDYWRVRRFSYSGLTFLRSRSKLVLCCRFAGAPPFARTCHVASLAFAAVPSSIMLTACSTNSGSLG